MGEQKTESRKFIDKLITFDTTSYRSNLDLIHTISDYLAEYGIHSQLVFNVEHTKANLFATIGPRDKAGVMPSGHTDVVPVEGQNWSSDPFVVVEKEGALYGRGTADLKSFIAIVLAYVPQLAEANLQTPVHLAFSYDEEIGCVGVRRLLHYLFESGHRHSYLGCSWYKKGVHRLKGKYLNLQAWNCHHEGEKENLSKGERNTLAGLTRVLKLTQRTRNKQ